MDIEKIIRSEQFTKWIIAIGILLAALVIFQAGVYVGVHKAGLSFRQGDNYYRVFGPSPSDRGPFGEELSAAHGANGKILSVSLPTFVVEDATGSEKTILVSDTTDIRLMREATSSNALKAGDMAIVIGEPDDSGKITATFIRLLPSPAPTK